MVKPSIFQEGFAFGDPYETRTRVTAVKGPCLNRLTNGPYPGLSQLNYNWDKPQTIKSVPATIYFPGQSPTKYHRRKGA